MPADPMPDGAPTGRDMLVVGDLMVDVMAMHSGPVQRRSDTPAAVHMGGGGSSANTACWLASAGRAVRLVAGVGADPLGRHALDGLAAAGVRFVGRPDPDRSTGACVVLVDAAGERTMLPDRGANDALDPALVVDALAERPAWAHLSGYTLFDEGSRPAGRALLAEARRLGVPASVDASSAAPLRSAGADRFLEWVDGIDVLFANTDEMAVLGRPAGVLAHVGSLVVKRGVAGATWTDGRDEASTPAVDGEVIDTTGAGDAFAAGYLGGLVDGGSPAEALAAGCRMAATAVATPGARPPARPSG